MLPKRTKYRKFRKIRVYKKSRKKITASANSYVAFGKFGLKCTSSAVIDAKQIEAARKVIVRTLSRTGKLWIRIFPHLPVTKKPAEVRMGSGKGGVEFWAAGVRAGTILFELDNVTQEKAFEAFNKASYKLPVDCMPVVRKFISIN